MTETVLITTGLGVDLLGGLLIVIPELVNTRRIGKKPKEKISLEKVTPREKYRYLKGGMILLMIGFFTQLLGNVLP
jgi:hypothetical protein